MCKAANGAMSTERDTGVETTPGALFEDAVVELPGEEGDALDG